MAKLGAAIDCGGGTKKINVGPKRLLQDYMDYRASGAKRFHRESHFPTPCLSGEDK